MVRPCRRILSSPKQWGRDAAIARVNLARAQERLTRHKKARREVRSSAMSRRAPLVFGVGHGGRALAATSPAAMQAVALPVQVPPTPLTELQKRNKEVRGCRAGARNVSSCEPLPHGTPPQVFNLMLGRPAEALQRTGALPEETGGAAAAAHARGRCGATLPQA